MDELLKENSGLLSRIKERDGNDKLARTLDELFIQELRKQVHDGLHEKSD